MPQICFPPLGKDPAAHSCCPKSQGTLSHSFSDDLTGRELNGGAESATSTVAARESGRKSSHICLLKECETFY